MCPARQAPQRRGGAMVAADARLLAAVLAVAFVIVVITVALTARTLLELRGLPVRAFAFALAEQLEVAVEAFEARRPHRRRHLALQGGLRLVVRAAYGF